MKKGEKRKDALLQIARRKFMEKGYAHTSVDEIIAEARIAKGTYYHYFQSKEQMLEEVIERMLEEGSAKAARVLASDISLPEKITGVMLAYRPSGKELTIQDALHRPENILLHDKMNRKLMEKMIPLLSQVAEEGRKAGLFHCDNIPERIRAILLLSSGLFDEKDFTARDVDVFIDMVEKTLGAAPGTMRFVAEIIQK
ncbi:MAG: TetR/AcrR family transcriptional regulator [Firmicutes bacterium]|nr:TetR/AcrR family transcriptional regulator [Bacillota bacterium]